MNDALSMDDLRTQIQQQMSQEQGPWRSRPTWLRMLFTGLPAAVVLALGLLVLSPVREWGAGFVTIVAGGLAAVLAFALATIQPARSERLAQLSLLVVIAGVVMESMRATADGLGPVVACTALSSTLALVATGPTVLWVTRSGFPFRSWHMVSFASAMLSMAVVPVWRHCPSQQRAHALLAHGLLPLMVGVVLGYGAHLWLRRKRSAQRA
jgi:hypothetical protein